jgi:hypothetical protein
MAGTESRVHRRAPGRCFGDGDNGPLVGGAPVIEDVRAMLAELASLAERGARDEGKLLEAARRRLSQLPDEPERGAERVTLKRVIARAEALLGVRSDTRIPGPAVQVPEDTTA